MNAPRLRVYSEDGVHIATFLSHYDAAVFLYTMEYRQFHSIQRISAFRDMDQGRGRRENGHEQNARGTRL